MPKALAVDLVGAVIMAFVLVHAVKYAGAQGARKGQAVGFLNGLGFIALATLSATIHEHRPFDLWLIGNGYQRVSLGLMGAILAAWRSGGTGPPCSSPRAGLGRSRAGSLL